MCIRDSFSTFLPDDPRFGVGRRGGHGYDCAIVFDLDEMVAAESYNITMTCQGNVFIDQLVNAGMVCQYVVRYDVARPHVKQCLYHKALQNEPITGYTGGRPGIPSPYAAEPWFARTT